MPRKAPKLNLDLTIRYDATLRYLHKRLIQYETEAAKLTGAVATESEAQRYQAALREMLEALIQHAREIAKLNPQLKRPN